MGAQEVVAEVFGETVGDFVQGDAAGVGGDDGVRLAECFHLAPEAAFDFEILGDGFDDPVAIGDFIEVVFEVAGGDELGVFVDEESAGAEFDDAFDSLQRGGVAIGLVGKNDIEEDGRNAGVGEVGGNPGAHGAGSEDGNFLNGSHLNEDFILFHLTVLREEGAWSRNDYLRRHGVLVADEIEVNLMDLITAAVCWKRPFTTMFINTTALMAVFLFAMNVYVCRELFRWSICGTWGRLKELTSASLAMRWRIGGI